MTQTFTTLIEPAELAPLASDPEVAIVDCRHDLARPEWGARAYEESHIEGSVFASLDRDLSGPVTPASGRHPLPDPAVLAATLGRWGIDRRVQVVAYDQGNGAVAARLWWMLRFLGHAAVAVLDGGFAAWNAARLPLASGQAIPRPPREFDARPRPELLAGVSSLVQGLGSDDCVIIDARAADRFAGRNETLDPVAGHVPGARNHPFTHNLDAHGRFLRPDELAHRWRATLSGTTAREAVCMCGSGVTACHNLLALEHAGLPGARLYAGSWSEWIRDPTRPVARE